jgi:3'(2'),5'-bisphosphate nucleotidase
MEVYTNEDFSVEFKKDASPLTKADKLSHEVICSYLSKTGIPILSEEGRSIPFEERSAWKQLWIVDPIDGTKEFIKRNGEFTVNIALIENQLPLLGVIFVPALNELYFASHEHGAFKVSADARADIDELMQLCNADITSKDEGKVQRFRQNFELVKEKMIALEESDKIRNWQPVITGDIIMNTFHLKPSKPVGDLKNIIRDAILDGVIKNEFEEAFTYLLEKGKEMGLNPA